MRESVPAEAVVLTPLGRGAVATILVEGPRAAELIESLFIAANGKPLAAQPLGRIVFGRWGGAEGEELVVVRRATDAVEIHCHGGHAAVRSILDALGTRG